MNEGVKFLKPIERTVNMLNGQVRVCFTDGSDIIVNRNPKRGFVLPRRKREEARRIGVIK